ncbi:MAG TPA: flagellar basal body protein [Coleofasciculaceae cyanobacterium]
MVSTGGLYGAARSTGYSGNMWISASGINDASLRMNVVANNIANSNTDDFVPDRVDSVALPGGGTIGVFVAGNAGMLSDYEGSSLTDYATEGVNLILAKRAFEANARMLKAENETSQALFDAIG